MPAAAVAAIPAVVSAAGGIAGGLLSKGGGGSVATTQQQDVRPWNEQGPYLTQGFQKAGGILNNWDPNPHYYPGSTVSPFNVGQTNAMQAIVDRASYDPFMPAASQTYLDTVQGKYLDPNTNPWLKGTYENAADQVSRTYQNVTAPTTDAMFASSGPISGGARFRSQFNNQVGLGETLNKLATDIYGGNYQQERSRQDAATGNVGNMIQAGFINPSMILNVGNMQQQQAQRELTDDVNRWNIEENPYTKTQAQWDMLKNYMGIVGGNNWGQSGTTTSQQPYYSNPVGQGIGTGLGIASLFGQMGWNPFGGTGTSVSGSGWTY